jgi:hypothetical protein
MESFKQGMLAISLASFTRLFVQALSMRQPLGLERVPCPTLFVAGEKEPAAVRASNLMLAGIIPHAKSGLAPGMGYGWLAEAPMLHCQMVEVWNNHAALPQGLTATRQLLDRKTDTARCNGHQAQRAG